MQQYRHASFPSAHTNPPILGFWLHPMRLTVITTSCYCDYSYFPVSPTAPVNLPQWVSIMHGRVGTSCPQLFSQHNYLTGTQNAQSLHLVNRNLSMLFYLFYSTRKLRKSIVCAGKHFLFFNKIRENMTMLKEKL